MYVCCISSQVPQQIHQMMMSGAHQKPVVCCSANCRLHMRFMSDSDSYCVNTINTVYTVLYFEITDGIPHTFVKWTAQVMQYGRYKRRHLCILKV